MTILPNCPSREISNPSCTKKAPRC